MLRRSVFLWAGLGLTPLLADTYSIIDLGGPASGGNSINNSGQIAGSGYVINNSGQLAGTERFQGTGGFSKFWFRTRFYTPGELCRTWAPCTVEISATAMGSTTPVRLRDNIVQKARDTVSRSCTPGES